MIIKYRSLQKKIGLLKPELEKLRTQEAENAAKLFQIHKDRLASTNHLGEMLKEMTGLLSKVRQTLGRTEYDNFGAVKKLDKSSAEILNLAFGHPLPLSPEALEEGVTMRGYLVKQSGWLSSQEHWCQLNRKRMVLELYKDFTNLMSVDSSFDIKDILEVKATTPMKFSIKTETKTVVLSSPTAIANNEWVVSIQFLIDLAANRLYEGMCLTFNSCLCCKQWLVDHLSLYFILFRSQNR